MRLMTNLRARTIIGAPVAGHPFGKTSKMPGFSYGLDAFACKRGSELAQDPETPCYTCYARRNFYATWGPVIKNRKRHQAAVKHPQWADAMVHLIDHFLKPAGEKFFRMHDSGDLVDVKHLGKICDVARRTPWLSYWLPTHEPFIVAEYVKKGGDVPKNLVVRLSADYNDRRPKWRGNYLTQWALEKFPTSTTHREIGRPVEVSDSRKDSVECLSYKRDHKCGPCRACWSPKVKNVSYPISGGATAASRAQRATALRVLL